VEPPSFPARKNELVNGNLFTSAYAGKSACFAKVHYYFLVSSFVVQIAYYKF